MVLLRPRHDSSALCLAFPVKILLIDDQPMVLETVALMLSSDGHTVLTASNALAGLRLLEAGEVVDLVLTDLTMPEVSGLELIRRVRARWPRVHVGIVTGSIEKLPADHEPLDVLITKPVDLVALRQGRVGHEPMIHKGQHSGKVTAVGRAFVRLPRPEKSAW